MMSAAGSGQTAETLDPACAYPDSRSRARRVRMPGLLDLSARPDPIRFRRSYAQLERRCAALHHTLHAWGTTEEDRSLSFPCDSYISPPHGFLFRGIEVLAPREIVYRWLCQLRVAPYAYDWLDNYGRQSPRELTPGAERLAADQTFMVMFKVVEFEPNEQITIRSARYVSFFTDIAMTYRVVPCGASSCRIVCKLTGHNTGTWFTRVRGDYIPVVELPLMHRQLRTIKGLAERQFLEDNSPFRPLSE